MNRQAKVTCNNMKNLSNVNLRKKQDTNKLIIGFHLYMVEIEKLFFRDAYMIGKIIQISKDCITTKIKKFEHKERKEFSTCTELASLLSVAVPNLLYKMFYFLVWIVFHSICFIVINKTVHMDLMHFSVYQVIFPEWKVLEKI